MVADALSCHPDLNTVGEVKSDLLGQIRLCQERAVGTVEWDRIRTDAASGQRNLLMYDGLVCHKRGSDSRVIVIPDDDELK